MANWTAINNNNLEAYVHPAYVNAAIAQGINLTALIADVTAKIRAAIAAGNILDVDKTKVPNSLVGLAGRMCTRAVKTALDMVLTQDERDQRKEDNDYLKTLENEKIAFETPDTPAGSAEMQSSGDILQQQTGGNIDGTTPTEFSRKTTDGLL